MSRVDEIFSNLKQESDGIWKTVEGDSASVSYPAGDHDVCFQLEEDSPWFQHRNQVIGMIAKATFRFQDVLDVGGGNGAVARYLESIGFRCVLVEPGVDGVKNAKKRGVRDIVWAKFSELKATTPLRMEVGLFDVVEHIEDDVAFMKSLAERISPDSSVALTVPAYQSLWSDRDVEAGHYRRYTLKQMQDMLDRAGFQVIYGTYFFVLLAPLMFLVQRIKSILGKKLSAESTPQIQAQHRSQHRVLNILRIGFWFERQLLKLFPMPFGASILVVARRK